MGLAKKINIKKGLLFLVSLFLFPNFTVADYKVIDVYDGDTLKMQDKDLKAPFDKISLRILGIDTPEIKRSKCKSATAKAKEKQMGLKVKQRVQELLKQPYTIEFIKWDKFGGRVLGNVYIGNELLSDILIKEKLGIAYFGKKKGDFFCRL